MAENLLRNPGFEADWEEEESHDVLVLPAGGEPRMQEIENIFVPPGWTAWFRHDPDTWDQPEVRDAWRHVDARRVHSGQKGILLFTFFRKHDAGFFQQVQVTPGTEVRLTAWAHAWSNCHGRPHTDDGRWSEGPGYEAGFLVAGDIPPAGSPGTSDDWHNFAFSVGIDPTGGTDPFAGTVVWGLRAHIYNEHAQLPPAEAIAQSDVVTVFLRSKTLWPFKHNDSYWDDVELVQVNGDEVEVVLGCRYERETPLVGERIFADALCREPLTNVGLAIEHVARGEEVRRDWAGCGERDEWYVWTWLTEPLPWPGHYEMRFWADGEISARGSFFVPGGEPPQPPPPVQPRGQPRIQYKRTYVLLPPDAGAAWAHAVVDGSWAKCRYTVGSSADDAGVGDLDYREVIAVNPGRWPGDLEDFFRVYYPDIVYSPIEAETPEVLRRRLAGEEPVPPGPPGLLVWQCDPLWGDDEIKGRHCNKTLCQVGCWVCVCAMAQVYLGVDPDATPATANEALGEDGFDGCDTKWSAVKTNLGLEIVDRTTDGGKARAWLDAPGHVLFAEVEPPSYQHWLLVTWIGDDDAYIYDPLRNIEGWVKDHYPLGIEAWRLVKIVEQVPPTPTLRGVHDREGLDWLRREDLAGVVTLAVYVGDADYIDLALGSYPDGIVVIGNLRYSYATDDGGQGTMPPPGERLAHFEAACVETMRRNPRVNYWAYLNEFNNTREYPDGHSITPSDYAASYNRVWAAKPAGTQLFLGAIDPYNPGWGDWRQSWRWVLDNVVGCDGLTFHAYTHGPELELIEGHRRFSDDPLAGVYYDLRVLESQQEIVPARFQSKPMFVTETNHFTRADGAIGWEPDAGEWVQQAYRYFAQQGVEAACLFRFNYDAWRFDDKPRILDALKTLAG